MSKKMRKAKKKISVATDGAKVSKINDTKSRVLNNARKRQASMSSYNIGFTDRMTQYDSGTDNMSGYGDIPLYFVLMNEKNGGVLHWPLNLKEKYSFYRFFYNTDAYVGAAIDLNVELPLSKVALKMPKMKDKKRADLIQKTYEHMCSKLKLFKKLQSMLFEYLLHGNCFLYFQYNVSEKIFDKIVILPPEDVEVTPYPMSDFSLVEYKPDLIIQTVKRLKGRYEDYRSLQDVITNFNEFGSDDISEEDCKIIKSIPKDVLEHVYENESILFETDPYAGGELGSFIYHMARRKNEYGVLGVSILERVLIPMLMKMHLRYTQLGILSRNMTPRSKINAQCSPEELENLRAEVDNSMMDPDYTVMTNYDWNWELISSGDRLIDLSREYETIDQQIFAALGTTKEIITGEGMYSGSRISLEVLNQKFLLTREIIQDLFEENIFKPVAEANGFYDVDDNGFKTYYYPKLTFSRISIRDNAEVFQNLFQLYQKGSVPIDTILEIMNIDPEEASEKILEDMFTVKDSTFNDMLRGTYDDLSHEIMKNTDLLERVIDSLSGPDGKKLKFSKAPPEDDGYGDDDVETTKAENVVKPIITPIDREDVDTFLKELENKKKNEVMALENETNERKNDGDVENIKETIEDTDSDNDEGDDFDNGSSDDFLAEKTENTPPLKFIN